jgi:hypothetical protein
MTKIIRTLTELITIHAIGLAITNLVGWWIVQSITGKPVKALEHAFFFERGWIYGTVIYGVLIQWYVWRAWLERKAPAKKPALKPRPTLASMYPPPAPSSREVTYTRVTVYEQFRAHEGERVSQPSQMTHHLRGGSGGDEVVDAPFTVITEDGRP